MRLRGDDVDLDLEPDPRHPHRVANAALLVHPVVAGQDVQDLAVARHRHGAGRVQDPLHVFHA